MDKFSADTKDLMQPGELKKPLDKLNLGTEAAALRGLVGFLNNPEITGAVVPPEARAEIAQVFDRRGTSVITTDPVFTSQSSPSQSIVSEQSPTASVPPLGSINGISIGGKIFFTGRIGVGKDYLANAIGAKVLGFADPMYALVEYLTGVKVTANDGKNIAGIRKMLQQIGQFGRDEVNEQYPYTVERSMFCLMVRSLAAQKLIDFGGVEWSKYGKNRDLWIDGLLRRSEVTEGKMAVTNCRF